MTDDATEAGYFEGVADSIRDYFGVTIRDLFGASLQNNAVHGSDAPETAATEIAFFFGEEGICPRTR